MSTSVHMITNMTDTQDDGELEFVNRPLSKKVTSALALKVAGANLDEICRVVGFASRQEATNAIDRALREELRSDPKNRERVRAIITQRYERLLRSCWGKANDPSSPEHLQAVGKAREILKDVVGLHGVAAPTEMMIHTPEMSEIEAWVLKATATSGAIEEEYDVLEGEIVEDDDEGDASKSIDKSA